MISTSLSPSVAPSHMNPRRHLIFVCKLLFRPGYANRAAGPGLATSLEAGAAARDFLFFFPLESDQAVQIAFAPGRDPIAAWERPAPGVVWLI